MTYLDLLLLLAGLSVANTALLYGAIRIIRIWLPSFPATPDRVSDR